MALFCLLPFFVSFVLDILIGDPAFIPHPVRWMGGLILRMEKLVRRWARRDRGLIMGGIFLVVLGGGVFLVLYALLLYGACRLHPWFGLALEGCLGMQLLAAGSLRRESKKVYDRLTEGDIKGAREELGMIVGRDTGDLTEAGIVRAAVETVAENFSDGVVAPLFYMALGGLPLAALYKFINTSDSMIGYRNERYRYLGRGAAKIDDVVNLLPARISGILLIVSAFFLRLDAGEALRIFKRDRNLHDSPNAGQTESAAAGALGIRLGGDASYFGKIHKKASIGEDRRSPKPQDIRIMHRMLHVGSVLAFLLFLGLRLLACRWKKWA